LKLAKPSSAKKESDNANPEFQIPKAFEKLEPTEQEVHETRKKTSEEITNRKTFKEEYSSTIFANDKWAEKKKKRSKRKRKTKNRRMRIRMKIKMKKKMRKAQKSPKLKSKSKKTRKKK